MNRKTLTLELSAWKKPSSWLIQPGPAPCQTACAALLCIQQLLNCLVFSLHFSGSSGKCAELATVPEVLCFHVCRQHAHRYMQILLSLVMHSRRRFGCFTNHTISSLLLTLIMFSLPHTHAYIQVSATCSYGFSLVWIKASSTSFNRFAQMEGLRGEITLVRRGFSALSM